MFCVWFVGFVRQSQVTLCTKKDKKNIPKSYMKLLDIVYRHPHYLSFLLNVFLLQLLQLHQLSLLFCLFVTVLMGDVLGLRTFISLLLLNVECYYVSYVFICWHLSSHKNAEKSFFLSLLLVWRLLGLPVTVDHCCDMSIPFLFCTIYICNVFARVVG